MRPGTARCTFFNSHPHKEDDYVDGGYSGSNILFNSHPHKEDDVKNLQGYKNLCLFNSHPHKEDDVGFARRVNNERFSTHILTRRMTVTIIIY